MNLDLPSEKQVKFIKALKRRKHQSAVEFEALLREHAGVMRLEDLRRSEASAVIDALQALPDPPR